MESTGEIIELTAM